MPLPLFYLRSSNYGDALNGVLFRCVTGRDPVFSYDSPKILAIGSIMAMVRPGDVVWGTGVMDPGLGLDSGLNNRCSLVILAVRGPLTLGFLREWGLKVRKGLPLGDPALLLPRYVAPAPAKLYDIAFLPHYADYYLVKEIPNNVRLLNPASPPLDLIRDITASRLVVSSSLHGLVTAEAYGIPAVWVRMSDRVGGGTFKYLDYYTSTGREVEPVDWRGGVSWTNLKRPKPFTPPAGMLDRLQEVCPFEGAAFLEAGAVPYEQRTVIARAPVWQSRQAGRQARRGA